MPASSSGHSSTATAVVAPSSCRVSGARSRTAPKTRPPSADPVANIASTTVAAPGTPCSAVNATPTTSTTPKIVPIAVIATTSTSSTGIRSTLTPGAPRATGRAGGSVPRCTARATVPITSSTAPSNAPASGNAATLSPTDSTGPTMKHSSSITASSANAVRNRSVPRSSSVHRARTMAPIVGISPAGIAHANSSASGASHRTPASIAAVAAALIPAATGRTRNCPCRSAARETSGVSAA